MRISVSLTAAALILAGCSKKSQEVTVEDISSEIPQQEITPASNQHSTALASVDDSLKAGSFDDAAAKLLAMRMSGREFSNKEAAEYRRALNQAYEQALEAADKGDPRARAAIEMIRAQPR